MQSLPLPAPIPASLPGRRWDNDNSKVIGLLIAVTVGNDERGDLGLIVDDGGFITWYPLTEIRCHLPPDLRLPLGWARKAPPGAPAPPVDSEALY